MATINVSYATAATIAMTNTSLAPGAWRCSAQVDNSVNLYVDALLSGNIQTGALSADGTIDVKLIGLLADGTYFTAGIDASNKPITWGTTDRTSAEGDKEPRFGATIATDSTDQNQDMHFGPISVASAFGGVMPKKWAVLVENNTGLAFHATGTNNEISYFGVEYTTV